MKYFMLLCNFWLLTIGILSMTGVVPPEKVIFTLAWCVTVDAIFGLLEIVRGDYNLYESN